MGTQKLKPGASVKHPPSRSERGLYMIELLTAIAVSALLSAALISSMAETMRFSSSGQNLIVASSIAQLLIDNIRSKSYDQLVNGTYVWHVPSDAGDSGVALVARPLQTDAAKFAGTATMRIMDGTGLYTQSKNVEVRVDWTEGTTPRSYTMSTRVSMGGIHS